MDRQRVQWLRAREDAEKAGRLLEGSGPHASVNLDAGFTKDSYVGMWTYVHKNVDMDIDTDIYLQGGYRVRALHFTQNSRKDTKDIL